MAFLAPDTGIEIVGRAALAQQVIGQHRKLHGGTALKKQHPIVIGHDQQLAQIRLGLLGDGNELGATVTHLHHREASPLVIEQLFPGLFQNGGRQRRRSRTKIIMTCHQRCIPE